MAWDAYVPYVHKTEMQRYEHIRISLSSAVISLACKHIICHKKKSKISDLILDEHNKSAASCN
jgi:hypothetical protein